MIKRKCVRLCLIAVAWFAASLASHGRENGRDESLLATVFHNNDPFKIHFFLFCEERSEVVVLLTPKADDKVIDKMELLSFRDGLMGNAGVGISVFLGKEPKKDDEWKTPFQLEKHGRYSIKFYQKNLEGNAGVVLGACEFEYGEVTGLDFVRINSLGKK